MISLVSQPAFLLATAIGFSVIAFDVANPASLHILPQYIDQPAHAWVKSYLPPAIKNLVAEKLVSDLFITAGIAGWVAAGIAGVVKSGRPGVKRITIALLFYVFGGGSVRHGEFPLLVCKTANAVIIQHRLLLLPDPFFVNQLKTHFQRLRPSDILKTYAFPSGHTTAAVFITGEYLYNTHVPICMKMLLVPFPHLL